MSNIVSRSSLSFLFLVSIFTNVQSSSSSSTSTTRTSSKMNMVTASFVTPKSPNIVSSLFPHEIQSRSTRPSSTVARENAISTCYGVCTSTSTTSLASKKRKIKGGGGGGGGSPSTSSGTGSGSGTRGSKSKPSSSSSSSPKLKNGKLQVQLLKHIAGTGNAGDIILVAPAFFENKLKKTKSAKLITDDEIQEQTQTRQEQKQQRDQNAREAQSILEATNLVFRKKAGPEGHLFGGIKAKDVLSKCRGMYPKEKRESQQALEGKAVKVVKVVDGEGKDIGHDIKELGEYCATISLGSDVLAKVAIKVEAE